MKNLCWLTLLLAFAIAASAQTPRPDDTPTFKIGATIYADYTYVDSPDAVDVNGNLIRPSAFAVSRAYINVTGNLNHLIAFRVTPDVARETSATSSVSGSQVLRLKFAYAQLNLDDWTTRGSWVRFGVQQTPYMDWAEGVYRYRFQGPIFAERIGYLTSSDAGLSGRYNLPNNYGDIQGGFFNGEGYSKAEANDQKAFQIRGTIRPLKHLQLTGFIDHDFVAANAKRERLFGQIMFEHPLVNAGLEIASGKDRASTRVGEIDSNGWSFWATPKIGTKGWELLLRHDEFEPNDNTSQKTNRDIVGVAYWVPNLNKVTAALLADYDSLTSDNFTPSRPKDTRFGLKMLINF